MKITLSQQAKIADDVLFQEVGGEAVLLNLNSETYFGLDSIGTRIWQLITEHGSLQQAFDVLSSEYEVKPAQLETDLLDLVAKLAEAGLLQVT